MTASSPVPEVAGAASGSGPRSWTITLREGTPILSANNRMDRWSRNHLTQDLKQQAGMLAASTVPRLAAADITVEYVSPPRLKRMRHPLASGCISDADNISPTAKACIDGIIKFGRVFPSDSKKYVRRVTYILAPETHPRGLIRIHISEVAE